MRAVGRHGTAPELSVRAALSGLGLRYRSNVKGLPGSPDLANKTRKIAIFVHGCFWHRHAGCARATWPKMNAEFWRNKFSANVRRDRKKTRALQDMGYRVLVVWECQTREPERLIRRLRKSLL
jgi:DNA mismatch endonuclease, patch repair protein